ncbi:MAG: hypothetical protein K6G07_04235 [Lachnospiraceae bacterium]|nr:hypothetical protein [Lachnospiraceae bacterium]
MTGTNMEIKEEHFTDWPRFFYETEDAKTREAYLLAYIEKHPDAEEESLRRTLFYERYTTTGTKKPIDHYMEAFLMLKMTDAKPNFLTRKAVKRDVDEYYHTLGILNADPAIPLSLRNAEWTHFTKCYLKTCHTGAYSATIFGMLPMKDENLQKKIVADIEHVGLLLPEAFDIVSLCKPFYDIMSTVYRDAEQASS